MGAISSTRCERPIGFAQDAILTLFYNHDKGFRFYGAWGGNRKSVMAKIRYTIRRNTPTNAGVIPKATAAFCTDSIHVMVVWIKSSSRVHHNKLNR